MYSHEEPQVLIKCFYIFLQQTLVTNSILFTGTTLFDLAKTGIESFLSHLEKSSKLEFVSLIGYSSQCELLCPFTRDLQVKTRSSFFLDY